MRIDCKSVRREGVVSNCPPKKESFVNSDDFFFVYERNCIIENEMYELNQWDLKDMYIKRYVTFKSQF